MPAAALEAAFTGRSAEARPGLVPYVRATLGRMDDRSLMTFPRTLTSP